MSDVPALERRFEELRRGMEWPATPVVAPVVAARLRAERGRPRRTFFRRPAPVVVAAVASAVLAAVALSPGAREAIADWLGTGEVEITADPPPRETRLGGGLSLGRRVSLAGAMDGAGFELRFPASEILGAPDEVYLATAEGLSQVSFVYDELRGENERGPGVLFMQLEGTLDEPYYLKTSGGGSVERVRVGAAQGYWLTGPHELRYVGPSGDIVTDSVRLAERTLLWEIDGITYRLEADISLGEARTIGAALR